MPKDIFDMIEALEVKKEEFVGIEPIDGHRRKFIFIRIGKEGQTGNIIEIVTTVSLSSLQLAAERLPSYYEK